MRIIFSRTLPLAPPTVARLVDSPAAFDYLMFPLLRMRPLDDTGARLRFPAHAQRLAVRLFGVLPVGVQVLAPTWPVADGDGVHELLDTGGNGLTRTYRHSIRVEAVGDGWSRCVDVTEVDAGPLTPLVRLAFWLVNRQVQRRWGRLVALVSA
ncbi:MAG TPA: hypothetical protein VLA56_09600 [Pseudomonadales bacterium]|nr:hypothetical protein [Pseudomonadales bacterium]